MAELLVYGSLEFGRVVKDLVIQCGHRFVGYIDDYNRGGEIVGDFAYTEGNFPPLGYEIVVAVGYKNLIARWNVFQKIKARGYRVPPLVHPNAYVRDAAAIGEGAIIMAGAVIDVYAVIAPLVVVWPGVVVNHDSIIHENSFLSPNATVCGCVTVGRQTFVGAGATIIDHVEVPQDTFIKAGSLYRKGKTVSPGNPA